MRDERVHLLDHARGPRDHAALLLAGMAGVPAYCLVSAGPLEKTKMESATSHLFSSGVS